MSGKQTGVTMADILALPDELRTITTWLMRQHEVGLLEVAAYSRQDEASAYAMLAALVEQGIVEEVRSQSEGQSRYRVRLAAKRGRVLPFDL